MMKKLAVGVMISLLLTSHLYATTDEFEEALEKIDTKKTEAVAVPNTVVETTQAAEAGTVPMLIDRTQTEPADVSKNASEMVSLDADQLASRVQELERRLSNLEGLNRSQDERIRSLDRQIDDLKRSRS